VDSDLSDMPYARGARFDPDKGCLPGTREKIIGEIIQWVNSPNAEIVPIFFLSGVAGYGKSAIAHAVARQFHALGRLGSSYCFDLADQANRRPGNLLSTIALDIADLDRQWKNSLCNVVKDNRSLRTTLSVTEQFKNFILEPAKALTTVGPILIVIDGLDESAKGPSRKALLEVLARVASDLPTNFRILITARPDRDIVKAFSDNKWVFCRHLDYINDNDKYSNERDVSLFIETTLSDIPSLESEWPNKHWCRMLLEGSDGLFQWASTACRAIKDGEGGLRETELLTRFCSLTRGLDGLYFEVLSHSFDPNNAVVMSRFKAVMGRILVTMEPLSVSAHSEMYCGSNDTELITQSMGSLLSGVNQDGAPVRALHSSFFDFLTDENRSKSYYVDASRQNWTLTLSTFRVMKELRFNICGLNTSHLRNSDYPDLPARIKKAIGPHLSYSCRFWSAHLVSAAHHPEILGEIWDFLHNRLLYWLEFLSLTKYVNIASSMLQAISEWNQVSQGLYIYEDI
jgi:hypothetical protein